VICRRRLDISIDIARIDNCPQPDNLGEVKPPEELSAISMPSPVRKGLVRKRRFSSAFRPYYYMRPKKDDP
jgi:hypothetical protein